MNLQAGAQHTQTHWCQAQHSHNLAAAQGPAGATSRTPASGGHPSASGSARPTLTTTFTSTHTHTHAHTHTQRKEQQAHTVTPLAHEDVEQPACAGLKACALEPAGGQKHCAAGVVSQRWQELLGLSAARPRATAGSADQTHSRQCSNARQASKGVSTKNQTNMVEQAQAAAEAAVQYSPETGGGAWLSAG